MIFHVLCSLDDWTGIDCQLADVCKQKHNYC